MRINKVILFIFILLLFSVFTSFSAPFFGSFYYTDNFFEKSRFTTNNKFSFYIENQFNDYFKLYSRLTFGLDYFANYEGGGNDSLTNFSIVPNIDLLYLEFKSNKDQVNEVDYAKGFVNYNFFVFRVGRVQVNQGSSFVFNYIGDGINTYFTVKNFRFNLFAVTNSFDYSPMFKFINSASDPIFTKWDLKRFPALSNYQIKGNSYGFIGDTSSSDYNFYFNQDYNEGYNVDDYTSSEKTRLNKLRFLSAMAGRIFTGFSLELMQIYFQNLSLNFLANIDLVPEDFVVTYPSRTNDVFNTFGGKYTSFYINFSASGKIYGGLYYNFDAVYETGFNATYVDDGLTISYYNALINTFAFYGRFSYFFDNKSKPAIHISFMYAHGDEDVEFWDNAVVNRKNQDNNYRSPTSYPIGFVIEPYFSNIVAVELSTSIKPFAAVKNESFSRFFLENGLLLLMRPIVKGSSFLSEKGNYLPGHVWSDQPEKCFLGVEIDTGITWQVFSDFAFRIKSGFLIPNFYIFSDLNLLWKVGVTSTFSF